MNFLALSLGGARVAPIAGRPAAPVVPMSRVGRAASLPAPPAPPAPSEPPRSSWSAPMIDEGRQRMPDLPEAVKARAIGPIITLTGKTFAVAPSILKGPLRTAEVVRPRHAAMWIARRFTGRSLPEIGRAFGGRDHTSVLHACRRVDAVVSVIGAPVENTPEAWAERLERHHWPKGRERIKLTRTASAVR